MRQFAVIGLGRFGSQVAQALYALGCDVLAIDDDESRTQAVINNVTRVIQADATDEETLKSLGIRNFDVVVVAIGHDLQASILVTLLVKEQGVRYVVAKAGSELHGKVLEKVGADKVVFPERDMGVRLAHSLVFPNFVDFLELSPKYRVVEMKLPEAFFGKTIGELNLRARYGVNVVSIKRGDLINASPGASDKLLPGDILVIVGSKEHLDRLERMNT